MRRRSQALMAGPKPAVVPIQRTIHLARDTGIVGHHHEGRALLPNSSISASTWPPSGDPGCRVGSSMSTTSGLPTSALAMATLAFAAGQLARAVVRRWDMPRGPAFAALRRCQASARGNRQSAAACPRSHGRQIPGRWVELVDEPSRLVAQLAQCCSASVARSVRHQHPATGGVVRPPAN